MPKLTMVTYTDKGWGSFARKHVHVAIEGRGSFIAKVNMVLFGLFAGWLLVYSTEAAQCKPDVINPCIFRCNGTSFDLSKAFNFP